MSEEPGCAYPVPLMRGRCRKPPLATAMAMLAVATVAGGCGDEPPADPARGEPAATAAPAAAAPRLTEQGKLLRSFEALLAESFGDRLVFRSARENFACAGDCSPGSDFSPYRPTFANPAATTFHVSDRRRFRGTPFGNHPVVVRIRGFAVACDAAEERFLVRYSNMSSFTLACLRPGG